MSNVEFDVLILAAGAGMRIGKTKSLLTDGKKSFIEMAIQKSKQLKADHIYIAIGAEKEKVEKAINKSSSGVETIHVPQWEEGMGKSISTSLQYILSRANTSSGLMILLVDQALLYKTSKFLDTLLSQWQSLPSIVSATQYEEGYGAPCIFPKKDLLLLNILSEDQGAKKILNSGQLEVRGLKATEDCVDIDTRKQYHKYFK